VMRGLERDPDQRFPDARAMASALEELLARENARPLEQYVDEELGEDKQEHRTWITTVLRGGEEATGVGLTAAPRPASNAHRASQPRRASSGVRAAPATPSEARPLVDTTTLVPPPASEQVPVAEPRRRLSPALVSLGIFGAAIVALVAHRLGDSTTTAAIPPVAPLGTGVTAASAPVAAPEPVRPPPGSTVESTVGTMLGRSIAGEEPAPPRRERPAEPPPPRKPRAEAEPQRRPEPAARRDTAPAAEAFGFLTVGAQPYALVRINGQEVGATPLVRKKLPAGRYHVTLVSPASGEVRLDRTVTLGDGQHERITVE
jgi:hypothetical protein